MGSATILGFPRIGAQRELKDSLENYWSGKAQEQQLLKTASDLRTKHWGLQKNAGLNILPSGDFSFYDLMLDMAVLFGAVPDRYGWKGGNVNLPTYFAMARGSQHEGVDVPALEMTKWFDTNYHYIVPELKPDQNFILSGSKPVDHFLEAKAQGYHTRPVLIGPITFLKLSKRNDGGNTLDLLEKLLPVYSECLQKLEAAGAEWVQLDEPSLATDLTDSERSAFTQAYATLRKSTKLKIFLASYFGAYQDNLATVLALPVNAVHFDCVRGIEDITPLLSSPPAGLIFSLGVIDGRNIWRNDLSGTLTLVEKVAAKIGIERVWISSSCSLLHVPYDLDAETALNPELKSWLAFAKQKTEEISALAKGLAQGRAAISNELSASTQAAANRKTTPLIHNPAIATRLSQKPLASAARISEFKVRRGLQRKKFGFPLFPTTTIGSFPQTIEVRKQRADFKNGRITAASYEAFLKSETLKTIRIQEEIGLDVLVHGEFERNDMVEYFGEQLQGFAFTKKGWVQSYGSRCVKPPIIFGDVSRPKPMTVSWSSFAQSLTQKPVKGMLTGPVTILQWSFVRDDVPRSVTAHQIALALQDEVLDLEKAGISIIQIDEPAFREGLPLRRSDWKTYLTWAAAAFRLSSTGVRDDTQIHTHMCYAEFNDIIEAIKDLDADVISIETSRSQMQLLDAFTTFKYPNEIGPGVYDIHSPRVPDEAEMIQLLEKASQRLEKDQIWVNPDCGLKTRGWPETKAALSKLVLAAKAMRQKVS